MWNAVTGDHVFTLTGNPRWIKCMVFSPDGKTLASGDEYKTIHLWDIGTKTSRAIFKANVSFQGLAFSPNGKFLASGSGDGSVCIWDATVKEQTGIKGKISQLLPTLSLKGHKDKVSNLAFSPDGKMLLTGSLDGTIWAWDTGTGSQKYTCPGHSAEITGLGVLKKDSSLTTVNSFENQLLHWDINVGCHISGSYYRNKGIEAITPDAKTVVIKDWRAKKRLRLWNNSKERVHTILDGHEYPRTALNYRFAFSIDGKMLASTTIDNRVGIVHLWNISKKSDGFLKRLFSNTMTIQPLHTIDEINGIVEELTFSPDGKMFATGSSDRKIRLWNVETGENLFTLTPDSEHTIRALVFSPDGRILASGGGNRSINLWNATTGKQQTETPNVETPNVLKYSPDGKMLISGTYNGKVQIFDAHSCRLLSTHAGHTSWVDALVFTNDGKNLVSASRDGTMLVWEWEQIAQVNW